VVTVSKHEQKKLKQQQRLEEKEQLSESLHKKYASKKIRNYGLSVLVLIALIGVVLWVADGDDEPNPLDDFATCLTEKGIAMYGAYWCPHCADQKKEFGSSFRYVTYVECDAEGKNAQPELCQEKNIRGYPTWIIDGESYSGFRQLEELGDLAGCELSKTI